ncbi:nucleoside 2-deoxyribosyltransferase [Breznakia pachnodae]|uniref:Nucleoside 2-deoxyribosyltransferase n=1 Tax=Breznakia pachnodae TaxID=265178 RepID=A0ABU0E477_9FIRM|nr:nucleoside 2-deoxyribosyltransferase [Breznakia pachnodae]MDQ0361534.1 nucleoside 2-deoxyribosyltransferase [Breznakia pachnodae]
MKNIYIGGPIQYVTECGEFDSEIKKIFIDLFEFFKKNDFRVLSAHLEEDFGKKTDDFSAEDIYIRDSRFMKICDIYLFVIFGSQENPYSIRSDGTCIELGWALEANKKIIMICRKEQFENCSYLLKGATDLKKIKHYETVEQLKKDIRSITYE